MSVSCNLDTFSSPSNDSENTLIATISDTQYPTPELFPNSEDINNEDLLSSVRPVLYSEKTDDSFLLGQEEILTKNILPSNKLVSSLHNKDKFNINRGLLEKCGVPSHKTLEDLLERSERRRFEDRTRHEIEVASLRAELSRRTVEEIDIREENTQNKRIIYELRNHNKALQQLLHDADTARQKTFFNILEHQQSGSFSRDCRQSSGDIIAGHDGLPSTAATTPARSLSPPVFRLGQPTNDWQSLDVELKNSLEDLRAFQPLITPVAEWQRASTKVWQRLKRAFVGVPLPDKSTQKLLQIAKVRLIAERNAVAEALKELQYQQLRIIKKLMQSPKLYETAQQETILLTEQLDASSKIIKEKNKEILQLTQSFEDLTEKHLITSKTLTECQDNLRIKTDDVIQISAELKTSNEQAARSFERLKSHCDAIGSQLEHTIVTLRETERSHNAQSQNMIGLNDQIHLLKKNEAELKEHNEHLTDSLTAVQKLLQVTSGTLEKFEKSEIGHTSKIHELSNELHGKEEIIKELQLLVNGYMSMRSPTRFSRVLHTCISFPGYFPTYLTVSKMVAITPILKKLKKSPSLCHVHLSEIIIDFSRQSVVNIQYQHVFNLQRSASIQTDHNVTLPESIELLIPPINEHPPHLSSLCTVNTFIKPFELFTNKHMTTHFTQHAFILPLSPRRMTSVTYTIMHRLPTTVDVASNNQHDVYTQHVISAKIPTDHSLLPSIETGAQSPLKRPISKSFPRRIVLKQKPIPLKKNQTTTLTEPGTIDIDTPNIQVDNETTNQADFFQIASTQRSHEIPVLGIDSHESLFLNNDVNTHIHERLDLNEVLDLNYPLLHHPASFSIFEQPPSPRSIIRPHLDKQHAGVSIKLLNTGTSQNPLIPKLPLEAALQQPHHPIRQHIITSPQMTLMDSPFKRQFCNSITLESELTDRLIHEQMLIRKKMLTTVPVLSMHMMSKDHISIETCDRSLQVDATQKDGLNQMTKLVSSYVPKLTRQCVCTIMVHSPINPLVIASPQTQVINDQSQQFVSTELVSPVFTSRPLKTNSLPLQPKDNNDSIYHVPEQGVDHSITHSDNLQFRQQDSEIEVLSITQPSDCLVIDRYGEFFDHTQLEKLASNELGTQITPMIDQDNVDRCNIRHEQKQYIQELIQTISQNDTEINTLNEYIQHLDLTYNDRVTTMEHHYQQTIQQIKDDYNEQFLKKCHTLEESIMSRETDHHKLLEEQQLKLQTIANQQEMAYRQIIETLENELMEEKADNKVTRIELHKKLDMIEKDNKKMLSELEAEKIYICQLKADIKTAIQGKEHSELQHQLYIEDIEARKQDVKHAGIQVTSHLRHKEIQTMYPYTDHFNTFGSPPIKRQIPPPLWTEKKPLGFLNQTTIQRPPSMLSSSFPSSRRNRLTRLKKTDVIDVDESCQGLLNDLTNIRTIMSTTFNQPQQYTAILTEALHKYKQSELPLPLEMIPSVSDTRQLSYKNNYIPINHVIDNNNHIPCVSMNV